MTPTFSGEVMLAGWAETHNSGAKIAFWLPDAESLDVFRGLTVKKGNTAGHRFAMVLVEIGEDEKPVAPDPMYEGQWTAEDMAKMAERVYKPYEINVIKGGELARLSGMLCNQVDFQRWFHETFFDVWRIESKGPPGTDLDSDITARMIRNICGVKSRAELDHNATAAEIFHERIRKPWLAVRP